jgi:hypothetical protein
MKNRETFNFYRSFFEASKDTDDKHRLAFYDALLYASFEDEIIELQGISKIVFTAIKPVIDNQNNNYLNGKKGGRPPKNNPPLKSDNNPPSLKKESYKYKEKYKYKDNNTKGCTLENLSSENKTALYSFMKDHCVEKKIDIIEIEKFTDHWKSTTKNATKKDWKATFRNWCRSEWVKKKKEVVSSHDAWN